MKLINFIFTFFFRKYLFISSEEEQFIRFWHKNLRNIASCEYFCGVIVMVFLAIIMDDVFMILNILCHIFNFVDMLLFGHSCPQICSSHIKSLFWTAYYHTGNSEIRIVHHLLFLGTVFKTKLEYWSVIAGWKEAQIILN